MHRLRAAGSAAISQFQLIGGIRHDAGDCIAAVEPGGAVQQRKGALYVVAEPAGDPAVGGEACSLVGATLAHEYYADPSPSITTSLGQALNKANTGLVQYNRQVFAGTDPPAGLPRKIRIGLSAAVVRPGQLYLCQLRPGLILWVHQGAVVAFPRPRGWAAQTATPNGDGEITGNFYAAPPLGTGPLVEADFAFRRFDAGDLLLLCSSNLAPLFDEAALASALPGRPAADLVEYLFNLARQAELAEAHALVVEMAAAAAPRRTTQPIALPPPPDWAPEATPPAAGHAPPAGPVQARGPATPAPPAGTTASAAPAGIDHRVIQLRPRTPAGDPAGRPVTAEDVPLGPPDTRVLPVMEAGEEPGGPDEGAHADTDAPIALADDVPMRFRPGRQALTGVLDWARQAGRRAAPVVGSMGRATLGAAGTAGKATLGAAGNVLGATLPENVRQRGVDGMRNPDGTLTVEQTGEDDDAAGDDAAGAEEEDDEAPGTGLAPAIVDFDAPGRTAAPAGTPLPWLRWLIPVAVVLLLGVLLFAVQQILSGQQAARVDGYLAQARQEETDSQEGATADRREHLMRGYDLAQKAVIADAHSSGAQQLAARIGGEIDTLNGVTRLTGLNLLFDFGARSPAPLSTLAPTGDPTGLGGPATGTQTATLAPLLAPAQPGDYLSQVVVHGDDAFLLDRGSGRLYRYTLSAGRYTTLLAPGTQVDLVGTAGDKARVGQLLFLTWRPTAAGGDLAVLDDTHIAYIWTPASGAWQAFALGTADKLNRPRDLGAYDGNLYLLWAKPGQVSKWAAGAYTDAPIDWLSTAASQDLHSRSPVAMAIDGDIHLLLDDGRIITLSAGEIKKTISLSVWPPLASPLAIFTDENSNSLYVVEAADKRIIRVDKASGAVQGQLKAPADTSAFDGLRNIYVDEAAGKIYVLSAKKLYVALLPPPPLGAGTPGPTPPGANATPTFAGGSPLAPTPTSGP